MSNQEYKPSDEDYSTKDDLIDWRKNNEIYYSPFCGYENDAENQ